jgi:hypothetical protein
MTGTITNPLVPFFVALLMESPLVPLSTDIVVPVAKLVLKGGWRPVLKATSILKFCDDSCIEIFHHSFFAKKILSFNHG